MKTLPLHAHPVERNIAHGLVNRVLSDGNTISVFNGSGYAIKVSNDPVAILSHMSHTGEDTLVFISPRGDKIGSVFLVYGNEPENLIADYSGDEYTGALCDALDLDAAYPEV